MLRNNLAENVKKHSVFFLGGGGFKTGVSKLEFKTDIENPKIEKLNLWFTLTGPVYNAGRCLVSSLGGFHLHLLVFPFVYQFNSRIGILDHSSFAND